MTGREQTDIFEIFNFLRFPLMAGVILIHCNFLPDMPEPMAPGANTAMFTACLAWFDRYILSLSVPLFFFMSGYLFFRSGPQLSATGYAHKLAGRARSLLIPYMAWNTIGLLLLALKKLPALAPAFPQYESFTFSIPQILTGYVDLAGSGYPYDFVLWFLRNLILIVILSPLVSWALQVNRWLAPALFFIAAYMTGHAAFLGVHVDMIYFATGAAMASSGSTSSIRGNIIPPIVAWLILIVLSATEAIPQQLSPTLTVALTLTGLIMTVHIAAACVDRGWSVPRFLTSATFFIYAFHGLFATIVRKSVTIVIPPVSDLTCAAVYFGSFAIDLGLSLLAFAAMRRICPRTLSVLCGMRDKPLKQDRSVTRPE